MRLPSYRKEQEFKINTVVNRHRGRNNIIDDCQRTKHRNTPLMFRKYRPYSIDSKKKLVIDIMQLFDVENEIEDRILFFIKALKIRKKGAEPEINMCTHLTLRASIS